MRLYFICIFLSVTVVLCGGARADNAAADKEVYWYLTAGDFKAKETAGKLDDEGSSYGITAGLGSRHWKYLDLQAEANLYTREYNTPPMTPLFFGSTDTRMRLTSVGVGLNAKTVYDLPRGTLYAGAGLGVYRSDLVVTGGFVGLPLNRSENDVGLGYQWSAGAEYDIDKQYRIGLEYRQFNLRGDFKELSGGRVDIGGNYIAITFRQTFQVPKRAP